MKQKDNSTHWWWTSALVLLALVLRVPHLNGSFWLDEAAQAIEVVRPLAQQLDIIPDFQPPLLHVWLHFWSLFSHQEWWLRSGGALLPGVLTVGLVYDLGRRWWGKLEGTVAAVLLATNSLHVFYSQELRPYALPSFLAVLGWWWLSIEKKPTLKWWGGFALISVLGLYASYLYPFVLLAQMGYGWLRKPKLWREWLLVGVVISLGFGIWLPTFRLQLEAGKTVQEVLPSWSQVVSPPPIKALVLVPAKFMFGVMDLDVNAWFLTALSLVGGLVCLQLWNRRTEWLPLFQKTTTWITLQQPGWLLAIWLGLPLFTSWLTSYVIPVLQPKRVLYLLPAWCLVLAWLVGKRLAWPARKNMGSALLAVLLLINAVGLWQYYYQPQLQRENWRALHQEIQRKYPPEQTIAIFAFDEPFAPWRWYDQGVYPTLSLGVFSVERVPDLVQLIKPATKYRYILVFDYLRDLSDPDNRLLREVEAYGYHAVDMIDYPNIGFVRVYARVDSTVTWKPL